MKKISLKQLATTCLITLLNFNTALATVTGQDIRDYFYLCKTKSDAGLTDATNALLGTIMWLGYAVALCVILVTGIQFLVASPQKKAQLKEKLWIILLGVIMLVAGVTILNIVGGVFQDVASTI